MLLLRLAVSSTLSAMLSDIHDRKLSASEQRVGHALGTGLGHVEYCPATKYSLPFQAIPVTNASQVSRT
jgi:hypothetical protein